MIDSTCQLGTDRKYKWATDIYIKNWSTDFVRTLLADPLRNFAFPLRPLRLNGAAPWCISILLLMPPPFTAEDAKETQSFAEVSGLDI
jgi:hypothetical protein